MTSSGQYFSCIRDNKKFTDNLPCGQMLTCWRIFLFSQVKGGKHVLPCNGPSTTTLKLEQRRVAFTFKQRCIFHRRGTHLRLVLMGFVFNSSWTTSGGSVQKRCTLQWRNCSFFSLSLCSFGALKFCQYPTLNTNIQNAKAFHLWSLEILSPSWLCCCFDFPYKKSIFGNNRIFNSLRSRRFVCEIIFYI